MITKFNYTIITVAFLKKYHACKEGINFFQRNFSESLFPKGLDLSKVKITGDYNDYFQWINKLLKCKFEYDSKGNIIKTIFPDGYVYEYDSKGNKIKEIYPDGTIEEYTFKYDLIGRLIQAENCFIEYCE